MIAAAVVGSFAIVVETAQAAEDVAGADERWGADGQGGTAEFQRHVFRCWAKWAATIAPVTGHFKDRPVFA